MPGDGINRREWTDQQWLDEAALAVLESTPDGGELCGAEGPGGVKCAAPPRHALAHWAGGVRTTTWDNSERYGEFAAKSTPNTGGSWKGRPGNPRGNW